MIQVRTILRVTLISFSVACSAGPRSLEPPRPAAALEPLVQVSNLSGSEVSVYLIRDNARLLLGRVGPLATSSYRVRHPLLIGAHVYAEVTRSGSLPGHVVGPFGLAPRAGYRVVVGDPLELTTAVVRFK